VCVGGGWFKECISKKVGNGMDTFVWTDPWFGGILLVVQFRQLYELCVNKWSLVGDMFVSGWEEGEQRGSGRGGCGSGGKSCYVSLGCCCLMLLCRFSYLISGGGDLQIT